MTSLSQLIISQGKIWTNFYKWEFAETLKPCQKLCQYKAIKPLKKNQSNPRTCLEMRYDLWWYCGYMFHSDILYDTTHQALCFESPIYTKQETASTSHFVPRLPRFGFDHITKNTLTFDFLISTKTLNNAYNCFYITSTAHRLQLNVKQQRTISMTNNIFYIQ